VWLRSQWKECLSIAMAFRPSDRFSESKHDQFSGAENRSIEAVKSDIPLMQLKSNEFRALMKSIRSRHHRLGVGNYGMA
jgi:hypothetical protein